MLMPSKYQPDYMFLRHVPLRRVHLFTAIQLACFAGLCVIKEIEIISIVFPLMASSWRFRCIDACAVMYVVSPSILVVSCQCFLYM